MRIGIDGFPLSMSRNHGIGNYTLSLLRTLLRTDRSNEYYIFYRDPDGHIECRAENLHEIILDIGYETDAAEAVMSSIIESAKRYEVEIFYTSNAANFQLPPYEKEKFRGIKLVGTIHDIIPWVFKESYIRNADEERKIGKYYKNLAKYDLLFADSESTKRDVSEHFNCRNVETLLLGANIVECDVRKTEEAWQVLKDRLNIGEPYFLAVLGVGFNKNMKGIVRAYAQAYMKNNSIPPIVFAGGLEESHKMDITFFLRDKLYSENIIFSDFVTDSELEALYAHARWCVFPTLYEGFGMPIVEAWLHGVPVMTSDNSSIDEIARGAAVQVNPFSVESIADGFLTICNMGEAERREYIRLGEERAKGFSWERTAEQFLCHMRKLLKT